jgi:site-specific DNA-methyltransferase (adenine-specific)
LLERIIKASSNEGDLIMDPFSGTFTTCYVAKALNRNSIGIELQDEYVKIGLRRLNLADEYKGEKLQKEIRTFETEKITNVYNLKLFEESNGAHIHGQH